MFFGFKKYISFHPGLLLLPFELENSIWPERTVSFNSVRGECTTVSSINFYVMEDGTGYFCFRFCYNITPDFYLDFRATICVNFVSIFRSRHNWIHDTHTRRHTHTHTLTHTLCNIYCPFTAPVFAPTHHDVTLHVHCQSCFLETRGRCSTSTVRMIPDFRIYLKYYQYH